LQQLLYYEARAKLLFPMNDFMASHLLALDSVTKQYTPSAIPAVAKATLTLRQGDLLGLLGPSGCGKTTLLRLIAGFEQPQAGTIDLAGQRVAGSGTWIPPEQRDIGMVFQDYALFPHLTVAANIAFGLHGLTRLDCQAGLKSKANLIRKHRVAEAIALVGLKGMENRYPHELSGGQQQRVALARALAPQPSLILLDEPLSNLDVQVRLHLRQEVRSILKATGISGIFVTHDQEEALAISDQIAVMHQGQIEQWGSPEEIYQEPASRFVAEFVTQANFLPARRRGPVWKTEVGHFAAEQVCQSGPAEMNQTQADIGELMIRQEDLKLLPDPDGFLLVRDRQFLGREYCYWVQTPSGQILKSRANSVSALTVGERVQCCVTSHTLKLFTKTALPYAHSS
jgi:iron(III) transport system ATP-binding protein